MSDPSPDLFLDHILAYQKTAALRAALELDVFTKVACGADTAQALADQSRAASRGIAMLCDYLVVHGHLEKHGDRYRLTPSSSVFLDARSPMCMASVADFLASTEMIDLFLRDPAAYVRNGGAPGLANVAPDNPVWVKFARAMVPFMMPVASGVAAAVAKWPTPPVSVLDIAAGHGMFGIALARALPQANVCAVDWSDVLEVAQANARAAGVVERFRWIAGSAFDVGWGDGYDLVMFPNFLHHFDAPTNEGLLRRAKSALRSGGRVIAVEMTPNDDHVTPPFPATFAFMMLGSTPAGTAYTQRELEALGRAAGFTRFDAQPLPPSPQTLITWT